ncbi:electron transport complex protein RnfA [Ruminococcus sp. YRD2003]|uniref:Rnf-Nqr domain containing protein n=1 Tax=Ruminococcus sp. YRD2003 TaxID=1452313 RepID=UPI0008B2D71B|nr:electron transport complex protein RnfA [Ruminococcus flavefaciens]
MFLVTELVTLLATNLILTQALGTSTLFIAAGSKKNLLWTAVTITVFTTVGSGAAYFVNALLPDRFADLTLLFYTLIIGAVYVLFLTALYFAGSDSFVTTRKYVHVSAFNCAVMGTLFTITDRADAYPSLNTFVNFVLSGAEAGTGFILAAFILTAAYRKLNSAKVPASFRGFPAMLVYLGLISMAVYALR